MFPILASNSASTGYNLTRSLRFRASATAWLGRTPATTTNQQTWTWSGWIKRGALSSGGFQTLFNASVDANNFTELRFTDTSNGVFEFTYVVGGADTARLTTTQVFRDPSAYYHVVFVADTTQATAANRLKLYVNGVQVTAFSTATYPSLNANLYVNSANTHGIGITRSVGRYYDGYMTEINLIDGQALTPSSFGSTNALTGVWQPARYTGSYGTNGFYLPFTDNSALTTSSNVGLGKDFSGNGNYWTTNNISITAGVTYDSMTDVPTLTSATAANFAVMNPLDNGGLTIGSANLNTSDASGAYISVRATIGVSSGKWYWEETATSGANLICGISKAAAAQSTGNYVGVNANGWGYAGNNGQKYTAGAGVAYGATYTNGDVVGVAFDADAGTLIFYKNNTSQGTAFTGLTSGPYFPAVSNYSSSWATNFGQRPFTYTPPTGFVALNTFNIAAGTVTTSGSFTGNLSANGPFVYLNGVPTAMTINGNAVTFGTQADKLANGFKVRTASALYNLAASNTYSVTTNGAVFKNANAQGNP